jgi:hypothetical protein
VSAGHNKKFYVGAAFVAAGMVIYVADRFLGHSLTTLDLIWHAIPFTIGGTLMLPKFMPTFYAKALELVGRIFGKPPVVMP